MLKISSHIALACLLVLAGCSKSKDAEAAGDEAAVTPVQVEAAKSEAIDKLITAEAILFPLQQATITPKISAPVSRFLVQRGDHVRQGQLIATLEDRDLVATAKESKELSDQARATYETVTAATIPEDATKARTDVETAQQTLDAAKKVYENRQQLFREGALAQKLVDDARVALVQAQSQLATAQEHLKSFESAGRSAQLKGAQAQVGAAQAHYEGAEAQVAYAQVHSPISGVVADRPLNVGEMASAGSALMSIVDISRVVARANIPVQEAAAVRVGRPATISGGGTELKGKVTVVSPTVDANSTTVQIWVQAANPGERLKLGTTVEVSVDAGQIPNATVIPVSALLASDEGGEKVMVAGSDSLAHERAVTVGVRSGDDVQILEGVKPGELVITQGALGLDDKAKIQVAKPGAKDESGQKDEGDKK